MDKAKSASGARGAARPAATTTPAATSAAPKASAAKAPAAKASAAKAPVAKVPAAKASAAKTPAAKASAAKAPAAKASAAKATAAKAPVTQKASPARAAATPTTKAPARRTSAKAVPAPALIPADRLSPAAALDPAAAARALDFAPTWAPEAPKPDVWTARPWVHPSARLEQGRLMRKRVPRTSHAAFEPRPGRDPIAILDHQEVDRLPNLVPLRHARMAESPFTYYRGTPAVMAFDLADDTPDRHLRAGER